MSDPIAAIRRIADEISQAHFGCGNELRDIADALASQAPSEGADARDAARRVAKYLDQRAKASQLDKESITGMHIGDEERECELTVTDLRTLVAAVTAIAAEAAGDSQPGGAR